MDTKIKWNEGDGHITAIYDGSGSGSASISSDVNEGIDREQNIVVQTTEGEPMREEVVAVKQLGLREVFLPSDGDFILADGGTFNVLKTNEMGGGGKIVNNCYVLQKSGIGSLITIKSAITGSWPPFFEFPVASDIRILTIGNAGGASINMIVKGTVNWGGQGVFWGDFTDFEADPFEDDTYIYKISIVDSMIE